MRKKQLMADLLFHSGALAALRRLRGHRQFAVLNFHRIRPDDPDFSTDYDDGVFDGPRISVFRQLVIWLKRHSTLLSEAQLLEALETRRWPGGLCTLLTFDDGYRDNFERVYPVLLELSAPAIFFLPVEALDRRELGWWDEIACRLKRAKGRVHLFGHAFHLPQERSEAIDHCLQTVKLGSEAMADRVLQEIESQTQVAAPSRQNQDRELMTWDQIRSLGPLVGIGSHTLSHRILSALEPSEQERELRQSKLTLQARTDRLVRTLSYPVGGHDHFSTTTEEIVRRCRYEAAFSFNTGLNSKASIRPTDIRRIAARRTLAETVAALTLPGLMRADEGLKRAG